MNRALRGMDKAEIGKLVSALRQSKHSKVDYSRYSSWPYRTYVRNYDDAFIAKLLGTTVEEVRECAREWYRKYTNSSPWSTIQIAHKVLEYAREEKQWPTMKRLRENKREGWPSSWQMYRALSGHPRVSTSTIDNYIRMIVENDRMFRTLPPERILDIPNVTTRRAAMEKYGIEQLLKALKATPFQQDDYGKLWRLPSDNQEDPHAQWLEVVNSTAEPDGSFAHYFLRVPPDMPTAHHAVRWMFQLDTGALRRNRVKFAAQT